MARGQFAMEFIIMIGFALVILLMVLAIAYYYASSYAEDRNMDTMLDIGYSVQNELILASQVSAGYTREIVIPEHLGFEYEVTQTPTDLVLIYKGAELIFPIPAVSGTLRKGANTITKQGEDSLVIS